MITRTQKRKAAIKKATPQWLTIEQKKAIRQLKMECKALNKTHGARSFHVDHIEPLRGKNVCGLHVSWNMRIIAAADNMMKGNRV